MSGCRCYGVLITVAARLLGWAGLRARRPNAMAEELRCDQCGRVWRIDLRITPAGAA
jgi:hypothetical protein